MSRKGKNKNERGVCGGERNIFEFELCNDCTLECKLV